MQQEEAAAAGGAENEKKEADKVDTDIMGAVTTDFIKDIVKDFGLDVDPNAA